MTWLLAALGVLVCSGLLALLLQRRPHVLGPCMVAGAGLAAVLGCVPAGRVLAGAPVESVRRAWLVPYGEFFLELDPLSAWFVIPILVLAALAALYGVAYFASWAGRKPLGLAWFFFHLLVASMVLVVVARNGVLFLVGWELMALASFALVTFEDEREEVRNAGWIYLVATHLGTAFLLALFLAAARSSGSMNFDTWSAPSARAPDLAGLLFVLAVIGFGTKAGFMPFHVWLPEAHPAAPSHVSALMSGVMIKTGIYGLFRALTWLGTPPAWWGWLLIGIGLSSGLLGVLFALAQHDLKRLLAYHSVENIGIIALGMGVGLMGLSAQLNVLVWVGFGGALLHVVNHALFKGLLFLGAGSVLHGTGTRHLEHLGGLLKKMPWTGATFLIGAVAISGLPPLNGFVSELLIFLGAYRAVVEGGPEVALAGVAVTGGLALIGGLAAACFTKAFGIVFLGEPRSPEAEAAHESHWAMRWPMLLLAAACLGVGWLAPGALRAMVPVLAQLGQVPAGSVISETEWVARGLWAVVLAGMTFGALLVVLVLLRGALLRPRRVTTAVTWDCGYARPTARMQYTASSFAQPLTDLLRPLLQTRRHEHKPEGFFPGSAALATETEDICHSNFYRPAFVRLRWGLAKLRWLQRGNVQLYVLYLAGTLLLLLIWKLR